MSPFIAILTGCIFLLSIGMILMLIRFIKGPRLPDRIVALDLFSSALLGVLAIFAVISGVKGYLDIALVFALITFLGTMTFAYYLAKDQKEE